MPAQAGTHQEAKKIVFWCTTASTRLLHVGGTTNSFKNFGVAKPSAIYSASGGANPLKLATNVVRSLQRIQRGKSQSLGFELNLGRPDARNCARPAITGRGCS